MKRILKMIASAAAQLVLLGGFDWFFYAYALEKYSKNIWWHFAAANLIVLSAVVLTVLLRKLEKCPLIKISPAFYLALVSFFALIVLLILVLLDLQSLKAILIVDGVLVGIAALSELILFLVKRHRFGAEEKAKKEEKAEKKSRKDAEAKEEAEEAAEEEPEADPLVRKKCSAMLLLMTYITDIKSWDNLDTMPYLYPLIEAASACRQYTYATEALEALESELKKQTNALKTYTSNNSTDRASLTANRIIEILEEREKLLDECEAY